MESLKPHKYAKLLPEIPDDEFVQIVEDIREHGQLEPVWLYDGQILDGVHRYRAAKKAGVNVKDNAAYSRFVEDKSPKHGANVQAYKKFINSRGKK